jgi:hypothetical protein
MVQNNGDFTALHGGDEIFFLKGNSAKKNYNDMSVTLGDKHSFGEVDLFQVLDVFSV